MEKDAGGHVALKTTLYMAVAVLVVAMLAGLSAWAWQAQGRSTEDVSYARWAAVYHDAQFAKSLLPMIDELDLLRGQVASLQPGTAEYDRYNGKLTELQNLIGDALPALVYKRDSNGNVTIVGVAMARAHLQAQIDLAALGRQ